MWNGNFFKYQNTLRITIVYFLNSKETFLVLVSFFENIFQINILLSLSFCVYQILNVPQYVFVSRTTKLSKG